MSNLRLTPRVRSCALLTAIALLPLAACGSDSPTTPNEGEGTMEMVVRDGPNAESEGPMARTLSSEGEVSGAFQGEVRLEAEVDGAWQTVTGLGNLDAEVELRGGESLAGSATVEARTWDRVRVVVSDANAEVDAGSQIGIGPIEVGVTLTIAGGSQVVLEHDQPVSVQADGTTRIVLDLNSEAWLTESAVGAEAVTAAAFEGAAAVVVQ
ncbi:MAG: hypothetical protein EA352_02080 [Gemmatimonadales bacterium]|nr:MAG: hypothetical protein EA352_02080 [Gemmatimonadales bacterium]